MKRGGAANRVTPCDAAGTPIGVSSDEAAAAGDLVNMRTFHSDVTIPVVASGAIAQDALLEPAANFALSGATGWIDSTNPAWTAGVTWTTI